MNVLFLPHFDGNPYQRRLAESVEAEGADVTFASGYPLSTLVTALRTRPHVIHVHWIAPFLVGESRLTSLLKSIVFVLATEVAKLLGTDVVWTVHNLLDHERRYPRYELFCRRVYARQVDDIVVHCEAARDAVVDQYRLPSDRDVHVVPHGHYLTSHENTIGREEARDRLGVARNPTLFLYLGQIRPYKQVPRLIDAFCSLSANDVRLVVAGKPTDKSHAEVVEEKARADPRVSAELTYVPDDEVQVYFNAADAVVLPYRDILTSGTAILGMSFGRPIIGPHTGCLPELLRAQEELLYDPEDESLVNAFERALDADLDEIGERNNERVMEFDWSTIGERTWSIYRRA